MYYALGKYTTHSMVLKFGVEQAASKRETRTHSVNKKEGTW